jgi:hypothetical protein
MTLTMTDTAMLPCSSRHHRGEEAIIIIICAHTKVLEVTPLISVYNPTIYWMLRGESNEEYKLKSAAAK